VDPFILHLFAALLNVEPVCFTAARRVRAPQLQSAGAAVSRNVSGWVLAASGSWRASKIPGEEQPDPVAVEIIA
jgi:hypothetical protein